MNALLDFLKTTFDAWKKRSIMVACECLHNLALEQTVPSSNDKLRSKTYHTSQADFDLRYMSAKREIKRILIFAKGLFHFRFN